MADVSVRPARPADAAELARIQLTTWRTAYAGVLPDEALALPEPAAADAWGEAIERPPSPRHRVLVAQEQQWTVGFAAAAPDEDDPAAGELRALLVEPRWGRRGHGSRLLAATVDGWRAEGTTRAVTWVLEDDVASTRFYASAGWAPDGARRGLDTGAGVVTEVRLHVALDEGEVE